MHMGKTAKKLILWYRKSCWTMVWVFLNQQFWYHHLFLFWFKEKTNIANKHNAQHTTEESNSANLSSPVYPRKLPRMQKRFKSASKAILPTQLKNWSLSPECSLHHRCGKRSGWVQVSSNGLQIKNGLSQSGWVDLYCAHVYLFI